LKKKIKILIIGGTGFIGYHLAKKCIQIKWNVTSLSTRKAKKIRSLKKIKYIICDISKKRDLKKKLTENFDYAVNLGGHVDHSNTKKTYLSHYIGLKNLTEILSKKVLKLFLQIGSGGEYGNLTSPQNENKGNKPNSIYYKSKYLATKHLISLYKKDNFPATILRLYQVYGPRQDLNRLIPVVVSNCLKNKKFDCSDGKQFRDFVYIDDVVNGLIKSLKNRNKEKIKGEIINLGSGTSIQVKKLILMIRNKIKKGYPEFGKIKLRQDEMSKIFPSISKSKKLLNWFPKISLSNGLKLTINDYKKTKIN